MMRNVYFDGILGDMYGKCHKIAAWDIRNTLRLFGSQLDGFDDVIKKGNWTINYEKSNKKTYLDIDELAFTDKTQDLRIAPALAGGKNEGAAKILIGIALFAVSWGVSAWAQAGIASANTAAGAVAAGAPVTTGSILGYKVAAGAASLIGKIGVTLAIQGVAALLAPDVDKPESAQKETNFLFNGAVNLSDEGVPIPLVYGRFRAGSVVVSVGLRNALPRNYDRDTALNLHTTRKGEESISAHGRFQRTLSVGTSDIGFEHSLIRLVAPPDKTELTLSSPLITSRTLTGTSYQYRGGSSTPPRDGGGRDGPGDGDDGDPGDGHPGGGPPGGGTLA